jgi:hypothetical protein
LPLGSEEKDTKICTLRVDELQNVVSRVLITQDFFYMKVTENSLNLTSAVFPPIYSASN